MVDANVDGQTNGWKMGSQYTIFLTAATTFAAYWYIFQYMMIPTCEGSMDTQADLGFLWMLKTFSHNVG